MKILLTTFTYPPEANGVSEVARVQAESLAERGHAVTVATAFQSSRTFDNMPAGVSIRQFRIGGSLDPRTGYSGELSAYRQFIAETDADVILCHAWQNWATDLAFPALRQRATPRVLLSHGFSAHLWHRRKQFPWGLGQWLRSMSYVRRLPQHLRAFDHVVFLSERRDFGRFFDHFVAQRLRSVPSSVIPNGIFPEQVCARTIDFRATYGVPPEMAMCLNVANYSDRKNQLATLRAFAAAGRRDAALVFIGSEFNDYSAHLQRLAETVRAGCGPIFILERIPRPHVYAAYQAADVFLLTAKAETQPVVLLEAMAIGLPFISTDTGCVRELAGGIVAKGDRHVVRAIGQLLNDPHLRQRLGEAGRRESAAKYRWPTIMDRWEDLFERLRQGGSQSRQQRAGREH